MSRASTLPQTNWNDCEQPEAAPGWGRWIFPILILAGMILIGVSVLLLLRASAPAQALDAAVWIPRL